MVRGRIRSNDPQRNPSLRLSILRVSKGHRPAFAFQVVFDYIPLE